MSSMIQTYLLPVLTPASTSLDTSADAPAASILDDPDVVAALAAEDSAQIEAAFARYRWNTDGMGTDRLAEKVTPEMLTALRGRSPSSAHVLAAAGGGGHKVIVARDPKRMEAMSPILGGVNPLPPNLLDLFESGSTVVRFHVGKDNLQTAMKKVADVPQKDLTSPGGDFVPLIPKIVDSETGIIQFGPQPASRRGYEFQPVTLLTRLLGVHPLPEPLRVEGRLETDDFEVSPEHVDQFFLALLQLGAKIGFELDRFFSALRHAGAWLELELDHKCRRRDEVLERGYFYGDIVAAFETDRVRLTFRAHTRFDRNGWWRLVGRNVFYLVAQEGLNGTRISIQAELLSKEDQNRETGHSLLRLGLSELLAPLLARSSPVKISPGGQLGRRGGVVVGVKRYLELPYTLPGIMNRRGKFLGSL